MCLNMRHNRWPKNRFWPFYNVIWFTWYLHTRLQKNFRYSMIWFVSLGGNNWHVQDFPGSVSWNPVKEFCSAPQSGMSDGCTEGCAPSRTSTHTLSFSLKQSIYFPPTPPPCDLSISLSLFSSPLCDVWCFWCPAHLYLFVILIYFSLSHQYLSPLSVLLFGGGEMFLQACRGFFVWSAVFSII